MGYTFETTDTRNGGTVANAYTYIKTLVLDALNGEGAFTFLMYWNKAAKEAGKQPIAPGAVTVNVPKQPQAETRNDDGSLKTPAAESLTQFINANQQSYGAIRTALYNYCVAHPRSLTVNILGENIEPQNVDLVEAGGEVTGIAFDVPDPNKVGTLNAFARIGSLAVDFYQAAGIGLVCYESEAAFNAGGAVLPIKARCQMQRDDTPPQLDGSGTEVSPAIPGLMTFLAANTDAFNALRTAVYSYSKPHLETADFIANLNDD